MSVILTAHIMCIYQLADEIDASTYMILRWLSFVGECMRVGVSSETLCVAGVEICNTE